MDWYEWASDLIFTPIATDALSVFSAMRLEVLIDDAKEAISDWLGW